MRAFSTIDRSIQSIEFRVEPVIIRVNQFTEESAKEFSEMMRAGANSGQSVIPIVIDSYGGSVDSLFSMISDIQHMQRHMPVATIAVGKAMSCGAALLAFGTQGFRYADPNARIMLHEAASGDIGKTTDFSVSADELKRMNDHLYTQMAKACRQRSDYFLKQIRKRQNVDWYLTAEEALAEKLIDHTYVPRIERHVKVEYFFG